MLNLTNSIPWEAGSIVKNIAKILYREENINNVSHLENFKGANPL